MTQLSLKYIVDKVDDIQSFPLIISQIIALTDDPKSSINDVEDLILKDQALTSKILRLANSTHYGYARRISTISEATILLGFQAIKGIAMASAVKPLMEEELEGYFLEKNFLWTQSQSCAIISRYIGKKVKYPNPEEAYIAGLLRDIGKTILNEHMAKEYKEILKKIEEEEISFLDGEKEVLGFDHAEIGERVALKWDLPPSLVEAIGYHHTPDLASLNPTLVSIVHIADAITMMMGIGLGLDGLQYNISQTALDNLNLNEKDIQNIISDVIDLIADKDSF